MNMMSSLFYRFEKMVKTSFKKLIETATLETDGQGTTEYAILVGVLVLMAIVAVTAFRGRLQELWSAITDGINSL